MKRMRHVSEYVERRVDGFEVGEGMRQGCVMSPLLFSAKNLFMEAVMKEVREKEGDV